MSFTSREIERALRDFDDVVEDVENSRYNSIINSLQRFIGRIEGDPVLAELASHLPNVDFDLWYESAMASAGPAVGSGQLDWPLDRLEQTAMQWQLTQHLARSDVDIIQFTMHFTHVSRYYDDNISEFMTQIFRPFARDFRRLVEDLPEATETPPPPVLSTTNRRVFVVHGHDEAAKAIVARFLEHLALEPIILHEQPNRGQTVIEKFERATDVGFAVVLLTPDDVGYARDSPNELRPRARQNVVLELGYFIGQLGRTAVCALCKEDIELPSDYSGVLYTRMDDGDGWKLELAREINAAGIAIEMNRVL